MPARRMMPLALLLALPTIEAASAAESPLELREALALPAIGRGGRSPVRVDPVEATIVSGRWEAPADGGKFAPPDGPARTWTLIKADAQGTFRDPALRGGYAYVPVPSESDRVAILEASGHAMVYVNGEPRMGDPYGLGYVRLPVRLRKGNNDLLFAAGRGSLKARLVTPRAEVFLDAADTTLPDRLEREEGPDWGAVVVVNASDRIREGLSLEATFGHKTLATPVPPLMPLSVRKVPFRFEGVTRGETAGLTVGLIEGPGDEPIDSATLTIALKTPEATRNRTFVSRIDGSVQYFGFVPALPAPDLAKPPGLILTLHGASVEGGGQARVYAPRPGLDIAAPTNRRPYGFDWEDWGRMDAIEVLDLVQAERKTDPRRTYLTGHSMGGHGTWHLGVTYPDRFAAIAPSAGWVSMASYAGARRADAPGPVEAILQRSASASDTLALAPNLAGLGVYVLHGDADDNVPVAQARDMRRVLAGFHPDFAYYERPGAGHWWGDECCDWPPLMEFLARHEAPAAKDQRRVDFLTMSPGISARSGWATVEAQAKAMAPSALHLQFDPETRRFSGKTENVARLSLDLAGLPEGAIAVELDGRAVADVTRPEGADRLWFAREGDAWKAAAEPSPDLKTPARCGPFKESFRNRMIFVYGTKGTPEEDAWSLAKARFDAESFYYRGNGSVDVTADSAFDPEGDRDRNVILYGNADTNAAWDRLLAGGPVRIARGVAKLGDREAKGDDLACLFVRPRPGSATASVGAVSGTGLAGLRLTDRLPYFVSGVGYPDFILIGADAPTKGVKGVRAAGFFGPDWGVATGEFAW